MIVKNEAHVIRRCLASIKHLIDYWVIVDTGSTDGTQEVIRDFMKEIPGELYDRPWVNFGHNRNEALQLARGKADYFLFIDADDRLIFSDSFVLQDLDKDYYYVIQHLKAPGKNSHFAVNVVVLLIKDLPDFTWMGALHEVLSCNDGRTFATLDGIVNEYLHDGARSSDPERHHKDVALLKSDLQKNPENPRSVFYLAQTYRGHKDYQEAICTYEKRSTMGPPDDEVFYSLYSIGEMQRKLKSDPAIFLKNLARAFLFRPSRAEPLFQMAMHFVETRNYWLGYLVASYGLDIPFPKDDLFTESWVYECGLRLGYLTCSFECGYFAEAQSTARILLKNPMLPEQARTYVHRYLASMEKYAS